jgi:hypothetical protein
VIEFIVRGKPSSGFIIPVNKYAEMIKITEAAVISQALNLLNSGLPADFLSGSKLLIVCHCCITVSRTCFPGTAEAGSSDITDASVSVILAH